MSTPPQYSIGDSLTDLAVYWQTDDGSYRDFSTGWTFQVKVGAAQLEGDVIFTKTSGITGAAGSASIPSVVIAWATSGELSEITTVGNYYCQIRAFRDADDKILTRRGTIRIVEST